MTTSRRFRFVRTGLYRAALVSAGLALSATGCTEKKSETPVKNPAKPAVKKPAKVAQKPVVQKPVGSDPDCVGPNTDTPVENFEVAGLKFERKGSTVTLLNKDEDDEFRIGQITDVKDHSPENAANLRIIKAWFKKEKVDAVALTGDLGESVESIEKVINELVELKVPILAIAGNRECRAHFTDALKEVSSKNKQVINMNHVRVFNADDASIVSMPGYYNRSYIHCAEGCEYGPDDVTALDTFAAQATAPAKVIISHGPPKMEGASALDRIHEGVNVGDPSLAKYLKGGKFPFGLFGNIQEAGGYGTDLTGKTRVAQDVWAKQLYINPGPIDSVRWAMLDGTESVGMAGLLTIKGNQAKFKIYRIKPGEAKGK